MRLLFLTNELPSPLFPGKGTFNTGLVNALTANGHEVQAIVPIPWTNWLRASSAARRACQTATTFNERVPVCYPVYFYTPGVFRTAYGQLMWQGIRSAVRRTIADFQPHVVVAYWAHPDGYCAVRAARQAGVPSVVMVGGSDILLLTSDPSRRRVIFDVLAKADAVTTVSEDLREKIVANRIDRERVHVVRRGIDSGRFNPGDRKAARLRLGVPQEGTILLWVGRMEPVKGLPVLVEAVRRLRKEGVQINVVLVGEGTQAEEISAHVRHCELQNCIHFVGPVPHAQLADYYRAADLTVLPSLSEGVPNVLLESIACGTPFVASAVGGIPEIASDDHDYLVPPKDPSALAAAIRGRLEAPIPTNCRTFVPENWPAAASRLIDVIQPLIQKPERPYQRLPARA